MNSLTLFIPGEPVQFDRPGATILYTKSRRPFIHFYDPPDYAEYKKMVRRKALSLLNEKFENWIPLEGALSVDITLYLSRPKTVNRPYPTTTPDIDNLIKSVLDSLNKILWDDDRIIVEIGKVRELYANGCEPGFEITVRPFGQPEFDPVQEALI